MNTSISVSKRTRDRLARIAHDELHGVPMDEALQIILSRHERARMIDSERQAMTADAASREADEWDTVAGDGIE